MCAGERATAVSPWRTARDLLIFAPIGLGTILVEDGPEALRRTRQELSNARFIGELTVNQGVKQIRARIDEALADAAPPAMRDRDVIDVEPAAEAPSTAIDATDLALPDYDTLPAIDIVDQLADLDAAERSAIAAYESSHRKRRTVLGKLAQLDGD